MIAETCPTTALKPSVLQRAYRLLWTGEGVSMGRILAWGALVWLVYSALQVAVSGIIPDQDLVPAQVIAGAVHYAPGHPHQIFYARVFNLPSFLAGALWALAPGAWISALRNCLFLFLSAFVPFGAAAVLTRKPAWGHAAAAFGLTELIRRFEGIYPMWFFPDFNSDGHYGTCMAVLIVVLLLAGMWRWGGVFLGLLPAIHPTMAIIVWPWSVCYLFFACRRMTPGERRRLALSILAGLALCAALALVIYATVPKTVPAAPYDAQANGPLIYRQFTAVTDYHRRLPVLLSYGYLVNPVALFALLAVLAWKPRSQSAAEVPDRHAHWLLLLGGMIWALVYGAQLLRIVTGSLPVPLQISMPGRFSNLSALLLIPLAVAAISRVRQAPVVLTALLLVQVIFTPLSHDRLAHHFAFVVLGAAFASCVAEYRREPKFRMLALLAAGAVAASLVILYFTEAERAVMLFLAGFVVCLMVASSRRLSLPSWSAPVSCALAILISIPTVSAWDAWGRQRFDAWYRVSPYDRQLSAWLRAHAAPNEPVLPPISPPSELEAKIAQPVLMEAETLYLMTYMPSLAPVIGSMTRDLYGIDYADPAQIRRISVNGRVPTGAPAWLAAWRSRTREDWQALGRKYSFRLILSPTQTPLALTAVLPGPVWTLYRID